MEKTLRLSSSPPARALASSVVVLLIHVVDAPTIALKENKGLMVGVLNSTS